MQTLTLQNGKSFTGESFGALEETEGEVVFTTGMVGYTESLSDPSFKDQILVCTYPLIGNYGVPREEMDEYGISRFFESARIHLKGLIVCDYSEVYSHWNAEKSLGDWMKEYGVPGISGVDTRVIAQMLREEGCLLGGIHSGEKRDQKEFYDPNKENLVAKVSTPKAIVYGEGNKHVAIMDTGMKNNILRSFLKRGIKVTRLPWNKNPFEYEIENQMKFDGIFFSNGPGDPEKLPELVEIMKACFTKKIPVFGICLGNQIMGLAAGGKTFKLKYGHRGQNQPCIDTESERCHITSQNHGFAVEASSLPDDWKVSFVNANDGTVEGIKHKTLPFFSVQFHPEADPGPSDTDFLFDNFIQTL